MGLVGFEPPGDAVARMNPDFIRKKRQSLMSLSLLCAPTVANHVCGGVADALAIPHGT